MCACASPPPSLTPPRACRVNHHQMAGVPPNSHAAWRGDDAAIDTASPDLFFGFSLFFFFCSFPFYTPPPPPFRNGRTRTEEPHLRRIHTGQSLYLIQALQLAAYKAMYTRNWTADIPATKPETNTFAGVRSKTNTKKNREGESERRKGITCSFVPPMFLLGPHDHK